MTPSEGARSAVKGSKIAAKVSILTPGIAPKSLPPRTPKINTPIVTYKFIFPTYLIHDQKTETIKKGPI